MLFTDSCARRHGNDHYDRRPGRGEPHRDLGTLASSINASGEICGWYSGFGQYRSRVCVRDQHGAITTFDAPGGGTGSGRGTQAHTINPSGDVVGYYSDGNGTMHGFVRDASGTITTFDVAGAGTGAGKGTLATVIDAAGNVSGYIIDAGGVRHGYLRMK